MTQKTSRHFSIAGLQLELQGDNNLDLIERELGALKRRLPWVDMVVLGELSLFGAAPKNAITADDAVWARLCDMARQNGVWFVPGSLFEKQQDRIYNLAPVISPTGEVVARYRKIFPFFPYEEGVTPGADFVVFDVPEVGRFGISICYDMWFPETTRTLVSMGAEVIIHPTMTNTIDRDVELSIARANAATNQCYFVDINVAGDYGVGRSIVCGPGGEVLHQAGSGREIIIVDIDLEQVDRVRKRGWHGLGQVLKSFRDNKVAFPPYVEGGADTEALRKLGRLEKPGRDRPGV
ncbi:carbon-nitrogen hydrolase family protein [Luteithermobacter gelatinilyticus]|uniref:carbon-nitrogen hydrolase family protein n=1 Tax=Luteithermobacter gelatinilyticus TaxID=2582913 RepID=UPI001105D969|nr:carbon-nitrogen hydrolase family protein [Luteithermobacter gelatinilyticus]|tara:strand:- start:11560 stop:12438 length:879 start_codon:yes stop_codon:yes gene_type:complete